LKTQDGSIPHEILIQCAKDKNLTKKSHRVFLYLLTLNLEDLTNLSQKDIGEVLDMDKSSVSLAIKSLRVGTILTIYRP
jgi:DNA-binding MarR family transcriptional regulator